MTSLTVSTSAADCYGYDAVNLNTTNTILFVAAHNVANSADTRTWIPFVVNIPQGKTIISATLRWVATDTRTENFNVSFSCEAADNASAPASAAALYAKARTAFTTVTVPDYTDGVEYSNSVTAAVQAVISRAGWVSGNTLAVMVDNDTASAFQRREVAAFEHATYSEPMLDIVVRDAARAGFFI